MLKSFWLVEGPSIGVARGSTTEALMNRGDVPISYKLSFHY